MTALRDEDHIRRDMISFPDGEGRVAGVGIAGKTAMIDTPKAIDVAALMDRRKLSSFNYRLIVMSWFITAFDGLDTSLIAYSAPYMLEELRLTKAMLGEIFAAGTAGMMVGGLVFATLADRYGRRPIAIATSLAFALLTIATAAARDYPQLLALRFLDGMAIGGMLPVAWALNIEFAPKRLRGTVVAFIMMGFALGAAAGAPLTNLIAPGHGWQAVYVVAGLGSLMAALLLAWALPESARFLISRNIKPELVVATLARLNLGARIDAGTRFVLGDEPVAKPSFRLLDLFDGALKFITPMLWLGLLASSLATYSLGNWGPFVLEELAVPRSTAALASSAGSLLGAFVGVPLMLIHDRVGPKWVALVAALAFGATQVVGFGLVHPNVLLPAVVLQGTLIAAAHIVILSMAGTFYPSAIRASGGGWASSVAKIGAVVGPLAAASVLSSGLPTLRIYVLIGICPAVLCLCLFGMALVLRRSEGFSAPAARKARTHVVA